jgi:hypothetical protein
VLSSILAEPIPDARSTLLASTPTMSTPKVVVTTSDTLSLLPPNPLSNL